MQSKAYDQSGIVHMTPHKGALLPSCFQASIADETQEVRHVSAMFLPKETPITCVQCLIIETGIRPEDEIT